MVVSTVAVVSGGPISFLKLVLILVTTLASLPAIYPAPTIGQQTSPVPLGERVRVQFHHSSRWITGTIRSLGRAMPTDRFPSLKRSRWGGLSTTPGPVAGGLGIQVRITP